RLYPLVLIGSDYIASASAITTGTARATAQSYYDPSTLVTFSGAMWEQQPVEVYARATPPNTAYPGIAAPEMGAFTQTSTNPTTFLNYIKQNNLGVIVVRNATARDAADKQQPYNL